MTQIGTAEEAIVALGGDQAVATRFERSPQCVRNWRYGRGIPPGLKAEIDADLRLLGKRASPSVYAAYKPKEVKVPKSRRRRGS